MSSGKVLTWLQLAAALVPPPKAPCWEPAQRPPARFGQVPPAQMAALAGAGCSAASCAAAAASAHLATAGLALAELAFADLAAVSAELATSAELAVPVAAEQLQGAAALLMAAFPVLTALPSMSSALHTSHAPNRTCAGVLPKQCFCRAEFTYGYPCTTQSPWRTLAGS